jgi:hypothetical protein
MAYEFRRIDMFAFDVHFTLKALNDPNLLQPTFSFLVDPALYTKQYGVDTPVETQNFSVQPITRKQRKGDHFWKYYGSSSVIASSDAWSLQLPFVCQPKSAISLASPPKSFTITLKPVIYLLPLGWSTNLDLTIEGKTDTSELISFVGALRSASKRTFNVNGKEYSLSRLFEVLATQFRKDAFLDPDSAEDVVKTPKHIVISLSQFTGPAVQPYRSPYPQGAHMPDADRALLHSILIGEKIAIPDLAARESGKQFMLTQLDGTNFAVTYFDIGTLLFMQERAADQKKQRSMECMASNIRKFSMSALALLAFYEELNAELENMATPDAKIKAMQGIVKRRLSEIPRKCNSALCHTWYQNYGRLNLGKGGNVSKSTDSL